MIDNDLPYNRSLEALESLLAGVKRPGEVWVHGALALPMPMIDVDGTGRLSFPLPDGQIAALIAAAGRAPYGRGEQTVLDTSARRVWQIDAARVRIGGKSWAQTLRRVLAEAARGLGCEDAAIRAELYKLLIYDPGGFFLFHRDSEKAPGMFGTLLIQLPSPHTGGELRIRHGSREARIDLSATDCSELGFAAFYADCEHEVRPVESGHRVCLVFNLLRGAASDAPAASAPNYDTEVAQAARLIGAAFAAEGAPHKVVWLLEHQYSQAELGFDALKGVDAAVVGVLRRAADAAACGVHLGVMHIEESGPAEVHYAPSRERRYRDDFDDDFDGDGEIDGAAVAYEVVEVSDSNRYIDHWIAADGQVPTFGRLPLADGELLRARALDDEPPDEDRLLEATGNEGVSFERAYRRAVLILWPQARQVEVLLQAGVGTALPALEAMLAAQGASAGALGMVERIVAHWSRQSRPRYAAGREGPLRLRVLRCPRALCELLFLLEAADVSQCSPGHGAALRRCAEALVGALPGIGARPARSKLDWWLAYDETAADGESCYRLLSVLERLVTAPRRAAAVTALIAAPQVFDPGRVLVPALQSLCAADGGAIGSDAQRLQLWRHCCTFLLARSEFAPAAPRDWSQPVALSCSCEDCRALQSFALDPRLREQRFRVRQDRR